MSRSLQEIQRSVDYNQLPDWASDVPMPAHAMAWEIGQKVRQPIYEVMLRHFDVTDHE